jgi:hypothetical protein
MYTTWQAVNYWGTPLARVQTTGEDTHHWGECAPLGRAHANRRSAWEEITPPPDTSQHMYRSLGQSANMTSTVILSRLADPVATALSLQQHTPSALIGPRKYPTRTRNFSPTMASRSITVNNMSHHPQVRPSALTICKFC